ncbi:MAG TPA: hypothetical protein VJY35_08890 [Candidatus Eisenbacteria bacterium]|nr:hypothetical protein [Candidatus Eisenbacteria bacterium]
MTADELELLLFLADEARVRLRDNPATYRQAAHLKIERLIETLSPEYQPLTNDDAEEARGG